MIKKINFFFQIGDLTGNYKDTLEETILEAKEYLKSNNEYCFFFRQEKWLALDKFGNILFESNNKFREFDAELRINNYFIYSNNKKEENENVENYGNES